MGLDERQAPLITIDALAATAKTHG